MRYNYKIWGKRNTKRFTVTQKTCNFFLVRPEILISSKRKKRMLPTLKYSFKHVKWVWDESLKKDISYYLIYIHQYCHLMLTGGCMWESWGSRYHLTNFLLHIIWYYLHPRIIASTTPFFREELREY